MGLRTFGELDVINRPLAKHNASEDKKKKKKKKAEKKIKCDKITVSYIAAGLLFLLYFLRGLPAS